MRSFTKTLLCLAVHLLCIDAGSRAWQPTTESASLRRRYFYINEKAADNPRTNVLRTWPDKTIRYCYESKEARKKFDKDLHAAHDRWITKGVSKQLKLKSVSDDLCDNKHVERETVLKIFNGDKLSTFPGYPGSDFSFIGTDGPTMVLTDDITIGMLDKIGNYAHELGHAWGLYHEHQNPRFWKGETNSKNGEVFGSANKGNWRCENLRDYEEIMAKHSPRAYGPEDAQKPLISLDKKSLCDNYNIARTNKFSASEYLPMEGGSGVSVDGQTVADVDWDSIMLYPSGAGAKPDKTNPGDPRAAILMKPIGDGLFERIKINAWPGQEDVKALCNLYGVEPRKGKLLQDKSAKDFFSIFKKGKDC